MRSPQKVVQRHSPSVGYGTQQFKEYDGALAQLEAECRGHIKCEQQMKLHIECMQEKIDALQLEYKNQVTVSEKYMQDQEELKAKLKNQDSDLIQLREHLMLRELDLKALNDTKFNIAYQLTESEKTISFLKEQLSKTKLMIAA